MVTYAASRTAPTGPRASPPTPGQWLVDLKPIVYLRIDRRYPGQGLDAIHPSAKFLGHGQPADPGCSADRRRAARRSARLLCRSPAAAGADGGGPPASRGGAAGRPSSSAVSSPRSAWLVLGHLAPVRCAAAWLDSAPATSTTWCRDAGHLRRPAELPDCAAGGGAGAGCGSWSGLGVACWSPSS